jgi:hypothetical protein
MYKNYKKLQKLGRRDGVRQIRTTSRKKFGTFVSNFLVRRYQATKFATGQFETLHQVYIRNLVIDVPFLIDTRLGDFSPIG